MIIEIALLFVAFAVFLAVMVCIWRPLARSAATGLTGSHWFWLPLALGMGTIAFAFVPAAICALWLAALASVFGNPVALPVYFGIAAGGISGATMFLVPYFCK